MSFVVAAAGIGLVAAVLADMVNTLVTTSTSNRTWWLTQRLYRWSWAVTVRVWLRYGSGTAPPWSI